MKPYYASVEELFRDWPMSQYTKEELERISQLSKERNEELTVRIYGRQYATFYPTEGADTFEWEHINKDGSLKMPPRNDKCVLYKFQWIETGKGFIEREKKVKGKLKKI